MDGMTINHIVSIDHGSYENPILLIRQPHSMTTGTQILP